jgi:hypothetical protein
MNQGTTQDENKRTTTAKRTVLAVLGALLFALPLHGQQAWTPDLRKGESRLNLAILVKF